MFCLTFVAVPHFFPSGTEQDEGRIRSVNVHRHRAAAGTADDHVRMVFVVLGLGDANGFVDVLVRKRWVEDFMSVLREVGWFTATGDGGPAVKKEDAHGFVVRDGYPVQSG